MRTEQEIREMITSLEATKNHLEKARDGNIKSATAGWNPELHYDVCKEIKTLKWVLGDS